MDSKKTFLKTQRINLADLNLHTLTSKPRPKSTNGKNLLDPEHDRDLHKKLYLKHFDYGKLSSGWDQKQQKESRPSLCTTARLTKQAQTCRQHNSFVDELFEDENVHPNLKSMDKLETRRLKQTKINTTVKDRMVITSIINKYQSVKSLRN